MTRARRGFRGGALRALGAALIFAATLSCADTFAPLPFGAVSLTPPAIYQAWWQQVQACAGGTRALSSVTWFVMPGVSAFEYNGKPAGAVFFDDTRRILIAGDLVHHGGLVRHEMLHALHPNLKGHPREQFLHRCGDVVLCEASGCRDEAGPLIPLEPTTVAVPPESLVVTARVEPAAPALSANSGRFSLIVEVKNPAAHSVLVTLPPAGDAGRSVSFNYRMEFGTSTAFHSRRIYDDGARFFRAGEKKIAVFDFEIGLTAVGERIPVGPTMVRGAFSLRDAPDINFTIAP